MTHEDLLEKFGRIAEEARLEAWALACRDEATGQSFSWNGEQLFHAASTFKAAILLAFARAVEVGRVRAHDHLHIRNRFLGLTDGLPYRIDPGRDGDSSVHRQLGRSLPLQQLARAMIVRSSNLATNLLLDFFGLEWIRQVLVEGGVTGVEVRRGVEDIAAHEAGLNNEASAIGLCQLFSCFLPGRLLADGPREAALDVLFAQEFNRMIPALLPKGTRVAHKTGEISTHCHDAGIIFTPGRPPYVLAILTQTARETEQRVRAVAQMSALVYQHLRA